MSTYISPSAQASQFVSGIPLDLVIQVGSAKQANYNQVIQNTQSQIDLYGSEYMMKDSDREYIYNKLNSVVDNLNKFSSQNLTDPRVQNELTSTLAGLSDPDITKRISNNRKASQFMANLEDIKKNKPELYNSANEKVAMKQFNSWLNDPENNQFNATYTPYVNTQSIMLKDYIKPMLDNPDVMREATYYRDPNTNQLVRRSDKEIKQITRDKIFKNLSNLPENVVNQLRIEYEASRDNMTINAASEYLNELRNSSNADIEEFDKLLLNSDVSENDREEIKNEIAIRKNQIAAIDNRINNMLSSEDPSVAYDFNTFYRDKLYNVADAYAFRQEGKEELDPIFSMDYKHNLDIRLEEIKNDLAIKKEEAKARFKAGLSSTASGITGNDPSIADDFADTIYNIFTSPNGSGHAPLEVALPMMNVGKLKDDGTVEMNLAGREMFIDLAPTLQNSGINVQRESEIIAHDYVQTEYSKWLDKNKDTDTAVKIAKNPGHYEMSKQARSAIEKGVFDRFLQSPEGSKVSAKAKEFGLDLTNPNSLTNLKNYINSEQSQAIATFGKGLKNFPGSAVFNPLSSGENIISDVNGNMYMKGTMRFILGDLRNRYNSVVGDRAGIITDSEGQNLIENLTSQGIIKHVSGEIDNDESVVEIPVTMALDKNLNSAHDKFLRTQFSGDKAGIEAIPTYKKVMQERLAHATEFNNLDIKDPNLWVLRANENLYNFRNVMSKDDMDIISRSLDGLASIARDTSKPVYDRVQATIALKKATNMNANELLSVKNNNINSSTIPVVDPKNLPTESQIKSFKNVPSQYKNVIDTAAINNNVPPAILQAMLFQESSYNPNAISPAGAKGIAQFMDATAKDYNVDSSDPISSINGAAKYLSDLYKRFGDWNLALAGYNAGPNRTSLKNGKIPAFEETQNYVARINAYVNSLNN